MEKTGIHFKTDVFAAVAVVDAKAPQMFTLGRGRWSITQKPKLIISTIFTDTTWIFAAGHSCNPHSSSQAYDAVSPWIRYYFAN